MSPHILQVNCWISKTPCLVNIIGSIFYISRVMANFVLKFPNNRYHGNRR